MAASGVGQFSINVKSNLKDFYGDLTKAQRTMKELTDRKNKLNIDSSKLNELRDKAQRIAAEMKELRQQKTEIKLGTREVDNAKDELKSLDQRIASLNRQKLEVEADIQPIRTANVELYKTEQEIDRINSEKVQIDFSGISGGLDNLSNKIFSVIKTLGSISLVGLGGAVSVLKEAVNAASDLEQNSGGVDKLFGSSAQTVIQNASQAYKTAGVDMNTYLEQATTFSASLISSLGGNQKEAADYVNEAVVDMSDNANVFGTDLGSIQNAYQGFAKNNYTMLDNLKLGFAGSQEGAMKLVNQYGGLNKKVTEASQITFPMMVKAIHNAQVAMKIAGDTAKEGSDTYAGSLAAMTAAWKNFLATGNTEGLEETIPTYFENLDKKLEELTPKIIAGIQKLAKELPSKLKPIIKNISKILTASLDAIFGEGFTKNFTDGMKPFTNIIKGIFNIFDGFGNIGKGKKPDLSWLGSVIPDLLKAAIGLKAVSVAFKGISFAQNLGIKFPSFKGFGGFSKSVDEMKSVGINDLKSLGMKMLTIAGISANIYLAAKALEEVQKIGDLKDLQPKMLAIAEAVTGMGVLVFVASKLNTSMLSGIAVIAGIAGDIYLAAKALEEVDNIDSDFGSVQSKIGQIALSITEMGVLAAAVGALMDTGVGAEVLVAGLLAILGIAGTLYLVAEALATVQNLDLDGDKINTSLDTISTSLGKVSEMSFDENILDGIGKILSSIVDMLILGTLVVIGNELTALENIDLDQGTIETNITAITSCLDYLSNTMGDTSVWDVIGEIGKLIKNFVDEGILNEFISISSQLEDLENISLDDKKIESNIKSIKKMVDLATSGSLVDSIKGFLTGGVKIGDLASALQIFKEFSKIADVLEDLQGRSLMEDSLLDEIGIIKDAIMSISSFATGDIANNLTGLADALDEIIEDLTQTYPPEFSDLGKQFGQKVNDGFKDTLDLQSVLSSKIKNLSTSGAVNIGQSIARAINAGVEGSLNIGDKIHNSIITALSANYSADINVNLLTNKTGSTNSNPLSQYPSVVMAGGGRVDRDSILQDTPEKRVMKNGEYVVPKKIVDVLGVPFFDKLRNGQISRTFAGLAQNISNKTSSVINNVYNNTTTQNLNMYATGGQDLVLAGNRRFGKR